MDDPVYQELRALCLAGDEDGANSLWVRCARELLAREADYINDDDFFNECGTGGAPLLTQKWEYVSDLLFELAAVNQDGTFLWARWHMCGGAGLYDVPWHDGEAPGEEGGLDNALLRTACINGSLEVAQILWEEGFKGYFLSQRSVVEELVPFFKEVCASGHRVVAQWMWQTMEWEKLHEERLDRLSLGKSVYDIPYPDKDVTIAEALGRACANGRSEVAQWLRELPGAPAGAPAGVTGAPAGAQAVITGWPGW